MPICSEHQKQNESKLKTLFDKCGWVMYPHKNAEGHQENTILHFKAYTETFQVPCQAQSNLDLPTMQNISHNPEQTDTEDEEYENISQVSVSPSKILFVYEALSDSGSEIQIMGDGGATIAPVNKDDLANIGPSIETGKTRISGVANHELPQSATTVQISLTSIFDNEWQSNQFQAAVLPVIRELNAADHTAAISEALKALVLIS